MLVLYKELVVSIAESDRKMEAFRERRKRVDGRLDLGEEGCRVLLVFDALQGVIPRGLSGLREALAEEKGPVR